MQTVLLVIYLMVVVALIGVVLIQRSEGGGLGIGGGSGFMSARGTANALTRTTAVLAVLFFGLALAMGILARYEPQATDILERIPGTSSSGGVLDSLGGGQTAPAGGNTPPPATGNGANSTVPADGAAAPAQAPAAQPAAPAPAAGANGNTGSQVPSGQ
ncbi:preprotein translocase subunit SecG [Sinorhizobium fredii]|uniref:Protein-export membrane protein SecG n=1 Tax=Rhizobium fredii TaxID=380 RepID=A0A2A6LVE0_RHIFR|nr:preprotein translocase subunit SecG [Sinorhizobium fredii]ASY68607.1 Preprotein translocase subunit SecG [Sinorhizobium fredii CCBAU 83666]AWM24679.1 Preprotein translocase subunit SecG [Sinorhizobium fredii CCBAU 25509]MCG5476041.1 preprotein translocase subunit SecG [Sinorhizobium fredii]MQW98275.1 preprotein translocase subunit SecG [Sinorhizobium fredii]MQX08910.1 preprotein translocase subunit SecG [Sinorhizobium fredii]